MTTGKSTQNLDSACGILFFLAEVCPLYIHTNNLPDLNESCLAAVNNTFIAGAC